MIHKACFLGVAAVVLMLGQAVYADFGALIDLDGPAPTDVTGGTLMEVVVDDILQSYNASGNGTTVGSISLVFVGSSSASGVPMDWSTLTTGIGDAWTWDAGLPLAFDEDVDVSDGIVSWTTDDTAFSPGAFVMGTLKFNAPAYINSGNPNDNIYTLTLSGYVGGEATYMADSLFEVYATDPAYAAEYGALPNLTLGTYTFTVVPEPATLLLLGGGGAFALIRRKRK